MNRILTLPTAGIEQGDIDTTELGHNWGILYDELLSILARKYTSIRPAGDPMHTPPNRATIPANPNFSKDSNKSVGSTSSKLEKYTSTYSYNFVSQVFDEIKIFQPRDGPLARTQFRVVYIFFV